MNLSIPELLARYIPTPRVYLTGKTAGTAAFCVECLKVYLSSTAARTLPSLTLDLTMSTCSGRDLLKFQ